MRVTARHLPGDPTKALLPLMELQKVPLYHQKVHKKGPSSNENAFNEVD